MTAVVTLTVCFDSDDCVIALFDAANLVYLPARVMRNFGEKLEVNFCNSTR